MDSAWAVLYFIREAIQDDDNFEEGKEGKEEELEGDEEEEDKTRVMSKLTPRKSPASSRGQAAVRSCGLVGTSR